MLLDDGENLKTAPSSQNGAQMKLKVAMECSNLSMSYKMVDKEKLHTEKSLSAKIALGKDIYIHRV